MANAGVRSSAEGEWIAETLARYLSNNRPNPYDFQVLLRPWAELYRGIQGVGKDTAVTDLSQEQFEDFSAWLNKDAAWIWKDAFKDEESFLSGFVPAYLVMTRAKRLAPGSWLIHFTNSDPFKSFDRGATLDTPLWMSGAGNPIAAPAQCPGNLSLKNRAPVNPDSRWGPASVLSKVVFGFAFDIKQRAPFFSGYGRNAVLFKSDLAVSCYNEIDKLNEVVFPICSEYAAIGIYGANERGGGKVFTAAGEARFDTVKEIVRAVEKSEKGKSFGSSSARRTRWNPLSRPFRR